LAWLQVDLDYGYVAADLAAPFETTIQCIREMDIIDLEDEP
jgi:hypothetical protein